MNACPKGPEYHRASSPSPHTVTSDAFAMESTVIINEGDLFAHCSRHQAYLHSVTRYAYFITLSVYYELFASPEACLF
jgi:hypothetical protein